MPVDTTIHSDAYRDINDSWESDERGFIAEDEEAICRLQGDHKWFASRNLSFGVEGENGALVAVGPVPGFSGIISYYWHAGSDATANFDTWRRIVSGSAALRRALTMISLHTHLLLNLSCCTTSTRKQWWAIYR